MWNRTRLLFCYFFKKRCFFFNMAIYRGHNFLKNKHIIDRLQSEQGGRFFRKFNRNVISFIKSEIKSLENFRWMTLGQISYFLNKDNVLNMDARSVLSHLMTFDPSAIWNNNIINSINYFRFTNTFPTKLLPIFKSSTEFENFDVKRKVTLENNSNGLIILIVHNHDIWRFW